MARFLLEQSGGEKVFPLTKKMMTIGSKSTNDIVIDDGQVEDSHAVVQCDGASFVIQPAHRKADIYVNGKRRRRQELADGDEVGLGRTRLKFQLIEPRRATSEADSDPDEARIEGFRRLSELSQRLMSDDSVPALLETLMDSVIDLTGADKGFLILNNEEEERLDVAVARNVKRENVEDAVQRVSDSIVSKVLRQKLPLIVSDALHDEEFNSSQSVVNLKLSSVMCVPLLARGKLLGIIYVGNDSVVNLFDDTHLELLTTFAAQASLIVSNALLVEELKLDNAFLSKKLQEKRFGSIIGACAPMKEVFRTIEKVAPTAVNVLVLGETGTGKELIANEIHQRSSRANGPFVTINCGVIPESLLESELFGHVKGAFTGATNNREGKFQAGDGGTIFLDEIGEMPLNLQVKLLRVLQERTSTKVGATKTEKVDIRVIAATNRDLEEAIERGEFREDLFYRLNVVMLRLPPLRERGDDVVLIARYLAEQIAKDLNMEPKALAEDAVVAMQRYEWPGNIRQLENRLKKAIVLADGDSITADDLELHADTPTAILPLADAKERFAYDYIMKALERNNGNRTQTARELDVDPRTIFRYLEKEIDGA
jgi:transcriptional regulator with GAF, ATPase, and Fis domain